MDNKSKILSNVEMIGASLSLLGAALWIMRAEWVAYVFALGAVMVCVSRLLMHQGADSLALRRLFGMRKLGGVILVLSAALMFVRNTMYVGYEVYLFRSSWLIFFVVFAVIEVYTTIRILHLTREK